MYSAYDQQSSRSPGSHRNQPGTLNRMPSRQFDAYQQQLGQQQHQQQQGQLYPQQDDHQRGYDQPRSYNDRLNNPIHAAYGYDMGPQQGWNSNAFAQNGLGSLGGAAGTFGCDALGVQAARIEQRIKDLLALPERTHNHLDEIGHALASLQAGA